MPSEILCAILENMKKKFVERQTNRHTGGAVMFHEETTVVGEKTNLPKNLSRMRLSTFTLTMQWDLIFHFSMKCPFSVMKVKFKMEEKRSMTIEPLEHLQLTKKIHALCKIHYKTIHFFLLILKRKISIRDLVVAVGWSLTFFYIFFENGAFRRN
jgi:hypothetical protein